MSARISACFIGQRTLTEIRKVYVPLACIGYPRWPSFHYQTPPVSYSLLLADICIYSFSTKHTLGSDVDACVWGIVEVCLAILSACTPTFPALFRWRKVRRNSRPVAGDVKRSGSYPISPPDERQLGFGSDVRLANEGAVNMDDWSEVTKDVERGNVQVEGTTLS